MLGIIGYILIIINSLFACGIYYAANLLGDVNFHELAYDIFNPGSTAGVNTVIWDAIKPCVKILITTSLVMFFASKLIYNHLYIIIFLISILFILIIILLHCLGFFRYIIEVISKTDIYEKEYVKTNNVKLAFPKKKKNLILIYLESTESSLMSIKNGGVFEKSRIPELEKIAEENINFSNTEKLGGAFTLDKTSFTAGALIASTSGTPINTRLFNIYSEKNQFMDKVVTLGDLLRENGYNLEFIQGSDIKFAKEDQYLRLHGNYKLFDNNTAKEKEYIDKNYYVWWGMEDKKTLEYAKNEILELSKDDKPFSVSIFTIDTHFKDGFVDETFTGEFEEHYSNSFASSSKMVSEFVDWIKSQSFYNDTVIVITGDHQTAQNNFYKKYKNYDRTIYNAFINVNKKGNFKNRKFSMLDMYPTILSSIDVKIDGDRIGLGTNLFSNKETLIEKYGKDKFNKEISKSSKYYKKNID